MNHRRVVECLFIFGAMSLLMPVQANLPFTSAHLAQISANGTLTLKSSDGQSLELAIDTNSTSMIPNSIAMGSYEDVAFHGFATVSKGREAVIVRFEGLLKLNGFSFWVKFEVDKPADLNIPSPQDIPGIPDIPHVPLGERFNAEGQLHIVISETTFLSSEIVYMLMKGKVTEYGENNAFGGLTVYAEISGTINRTELHSFLALQSPTGIVPSSSFSFSFYVVTLVNATEAEPDYDGNHFYVAGSWNIYNRTYAVTITDNAEVTTVTTSSLLVEGSPGNLSIALASEPSATAWQMQGGFTLQIEGAERIRGEILFYCIKLARSSEGGIPLTDFNNDYTVNILDMAQIVRAFGAKLGSPRYNFDMDVNFDFVVDILDATTAAKEFGQQY